MRYSLRVTDPGNELPVSSTSYSPCASGWLFPETTETDVSGYENMPGTLRLFQFVVNDNATGGTSTVRLRKNAANGNQTFSIGAAATGLFRDLVNTDSVVVGDLTAISTVTTGAGSYGLYASSSIVFEGQDPYVKYFSMGSHTATANTTSYDVFPGQVSSAFHDTGNTKVTGHGVIKNLRVHVDSNTVSATSTLTSRKNSAAANLSVSIASNTTGKFTDLTNFDSVAPDDVYCLRMVTGATGTSMVYQYWVDMKMNDYRIWFVCQESSALGFGTTNYFPFSGTTFATTESFTPMSTNCHMAASLTTIRAFLNSANGVSTVRSRKGTRGTTLSNGNLVVSITASTTGWYSDVTNNDIILPTDDFHYSIVVGGSSGSLTTLGLSTQMEIFSVNQTVNGFPIGAPRKTTVPNGISTSRGGN